MHDAIFCVSVHKCQDDIKAMFVTQTQLLRALHSLVKLIQQIMIFQFIALRFIKSILFKFNQLSSTAMFCYNFLTQYHEFFWFTLQKM